MSIENLSIVSPIGSLDKVRSRHLPHLFVLAVSMVLAAGCAPVRTLPEVTARAETQPVPSSGDAADDPAIWVHPHQPEQSRVLGANKRGALHVYDLEGNELQLLKVGSVNNVDLRQNIPWNGDSIDLAAATNRSHQTISLFLIDEDGVVHFLQEDSFASGFLDPYGLCMYHDREGGALYVFANDPEGRFRQWRLERGSDGGIEASLEREFRLHSQTEGCVVDDRRGVIYIAEEDVGIWSADAWPDAPFKRHIVDRTFGPNLTADVEGLSLYRDGDRNLLIASSQGDNSFAVYDTDNANAFLGSFRIGDDPAGGVDGASETDGIEASAEVVTRDFPAGLLVVQDGVNTPAGERQNFKLISMAEVLERR